jgi:hypothetical protein
MSSLGKTKFLKLIVDNFFYILILFLSLGLFSLSIFKTRLVLKASIKSPREAKDETSLVVLPSVFPTISPILTPTPEKTNPTSVPLSYKTCIVTLFGRQYDITSMKIKPEEKDIFVCGEDISDSYKAKFGTKVDRLRKYLIGEKEEGEDD